MALKPEHSPRRPCPCGGANPNCPQCEGRGFIEPSRIRSIMSGPAGVRKRLPIARENVGTIQGPPEPVRCPHCGLDVLLLAVHLTEAHPELPQQETAAEREAREQEEARQAAVAAEIAQREAEAAQRKAEARARRQEVEGPQAPAAWAGHARGTLRKTPLRPQTELGRPADTSTSADPPVASGAPDTVSPDRGHPRPPVREVERGAGTETRLAGPEDEAWERLRRAFAERTVLTGVIRSRKPFGVFVNLGGIDGLVRTHELPVQEREREAPGLHDGQTVKVVVIGMSEDSRRVELSMRRTGDPQTPHREQRATGMQARPVEGPMALAFRLALEKKKRAE